MHTRLVSYLLDNRDHIIENWLTEVELPSPIRSESAESGVVPYTFFAKAFDLVLERIASGKEGKSEPDYPNINEFLGITCECKQRCFGGRVCLELHDAGLQAFMSVFAEDWDIEHEFNALDRECCQDLINHMLSGFFGKQVKLCEQRKVRNDCPFVAKN